MSVDFVLVLGEVDVEEGVQQIKPILAFGVHILVEFHCLLVDPGRYVAVVACFMQGRLVETVAIERRIQG